MAGKLSAATNRALRLLKRCNYETRKLVWDTYLRPISTNCSLIACTSKQRILDTYDRSYRRFFSRCKPNVETQKIAEPTQYMWMKSDMKWAFALRNDQLRAFWRSSYLQEQQERPSTDQVQYGSNSNNNPNGANPPGAPRQRRPRNSDYTNIHVRGPLDLGRSVPKLGPKERSCSILGRIQQTMGKLKPVNSNSWESVKREIECTVLPTLYSSHVYNKLKEGQLMSRTDHLAEVRKQEERRLNSQTIW